VGHAVLDDLFPATVGTPCICGPMQGINQTRAAIVWGPESVPRFGVGIGVDNRVDQTSDTRRHRNRAVRHRLHLRKTAWLKSTRHHVQVAARKNPVRKTEVIALSKTNVARRFCRSLVECRGEPRISGAQNNERRTPRVEVLPSVEQEIHALLVDETTHHPDHRSRRIRRQPELGEERIATIGLRL
jgi:hypothetical protein